MSWRFRKSFKLLPGVRLNVSRSGISTTIGAAPFSVNIGPRGAFSTASLPGSGIAVRQRIGQAPASSPPAFPTGPGQQFPAPAVPESSQQTALPPTSEIRSSGTEQLTSAGLTSFRNLLREAETERAELGVEIENVSKQVKEASSVYQSWSHGWFWRRVRSSRFKELERIAEETAARLAELQEQLSLAQLATQINLPTELSQSFYRLCDSFSAMADSSWIWDTLASRATNQRLERTLANAVITRERVKFALGQSDLLKSEWRVPHLENRNGGDLFIYPGFVLYRVSRQAFAVLESREIVVRYTPCQFHESEAVPPGSELIGYTWSKANKDGSPDRRFRDNRQIPVVRYGQLILTSPSGLHEEYLVSNASSVERFVADWQTHHAALS